MWRWNVYWTEISLWPWIPLSWQHRRVPLSYVRVPLSYVTYYVQCASKSWPSTKKSDFWKTVEYFLMFSVFYSLHIFISPPKVRRLSHRAASRCSSVNTYLGYFVWRESLLSLRVRRLWMKLWNLPQILICKWALLKRFLRSEVKGQGRDADR